METKYQNVAYMLMLYLLDRLPNENMDGQGGLVEQFNLATKGSRELPQKAV